MKQEKNRQTTTYIKFSYGKRTWYLGFYISCSTCSNVCAYVMSNNRKVCQNCRSKVIVTFTPPTQNTFKNYCQSKQIKHYISNKELEFLFDQVTSKSGYNMLKDDIFINHSFNSEYFLILRKKKEATFEREDIEVAEQSTSAGKNFMVDNITTNLQELEIREQKNVLSWQEILNKFVPITKHEFHRGLNSVRDLDILKIFHDGVKKKDAIITSLTVT
ncbi:hypothetical protein GLOIN_2v1882411 [Rhizophagus irregularis DAOM 181602=DAOM 197198]|nr:hypothetical protein GLOIN_2v1882411 [Rhizophagus irregularis DAOM 181602=DAOM 197198]